MLLTVGERISCALVAMAINDLGREAISLTGSQAGIVTDTVHGKAKIVEVRARRIHQALDRDQIVLVAGFQGISTELDLTTLGRGGTDTTAVALTAALGATACEIYTDVEGVFTADPRLVPDARKLHAVTLRGDARDGGGGCERASATLGRVRTQHGRQAPRPLDVQRRAGHVGHGGGRADAREGDHLGSDRTRPKRPCTACTAPRPPSSSRRSPTGT